ncbi:biotin-dependent carboxyltransferase family protein [Primorskyibacter sp. S87]|uniref:5-oxoprolinase subunit C family protein n=1 Tax=Primorskyibacter sp. S87 TaxID=3415126 RepID=UPI003C7ED5ED
MSLRVLDIGPACTVQDMGREGFLDQGLSRSGAADLLALHEGATLLGQDPGLAALEMAGMGGSFEALQDTRIALTGAPMLASIDAVPVVWNTSHMLGKGQRLTIGAVRRGSYGYLHLGGGVGVAEMLHSRSTHLAAHLGTVVQQGDILPTLPDGGDRIGMMLPVDDRFSGGTLRVLKSFQTGLFSPDTLARFEETIFRRGPRANRMGMQLESDGEGFSASGQLNILSEVITPGDIQMTGTGNPFILLPECQTTGGYPRIATVLPCDIPRAAQAQPGAQIRFRFVSLPDALTLHEAFQRDLVKLPGRPEPQVRDPNDMPDLLSYQLVGGVISATEPGD